MTTIKPLADRVLIEPLKAEETTASGLVIPASAQNTPQEAMVIAVGPEVTDVAIGDRVVYSLYGGTKLDYDGKSYIVIDFTDLVCVVEQGWTSMSKRDVWTAFFVYFLSGELVVTGASLALNNMLVFWIGQPITLFGALLVTALTTNQKKDK